MNQSITIAHNAVTAKIMNEVIPNEVKGIVQDLLSYKVEGAEFSASYKMKRWDGRSSFYSFKDRTFPRGFVQYVSYGLRNAGYEVRILKKPLPEPLGVDKPSIPEFPYSERYQYQHEIPEILAKHGQIIAQVATGGGKTAVARMCVQKIARPTLFLTTRGVLMYQMARQFEKDGRNVAIFGDGFKEISADVICGMVQSISSWLKETTIERELEKLVEKYNDKRNFTEKFKKKMASDAILIADKQNRRHKAMVELLGRIEFVILEEAHESSGNSYYDILRYCKNAHYRLALTATPFMRDSEESNMRLMASSGHIGITVTERELIDKGILAKPYFKFVSLKEKPEKLIRSMNWQRAYEIGIVENQYRNRQIVMEASRAVSYGLSVMILVQRKKHGMTLLDMLKSAGLRSEYILGEDNQEERDAALGKLKHKQIDVLIGTTILDVGVDVPAVGMVILAGGGKAEVALRQRIGRGLREKKDGSPNVALIVDFTDEHNRHLMEHALQRRQIILDTDGFRQNVVSDFDYKKLGFLQKAV